MCVCVCVCVCARSLGLARTFAHAFARATLFPHRTSGQAASRRLVFFRCLMAKNGTGSVFGSSSVAATVRRSSGVEPSDGKLEVVPPVLILQHAGFGSKDLEVHP